MEERRKRGTVMKKYYKSCFKETASVTKVRNGYRLRMATPAGELYYNKVLKSKMSCKRVMTRENVGEMKEVTT